MKRSTLFYWMSCLSLVGLITLFMNWYSWISPPKEVPRALVLMVLVLPLLTPLRGILNGRRYTFAWTSFLALFYFGLGVDFIWNQPHEFPLGPLTTGMGLGLFVGCLGYVKYHRLEQVSAAAEEA